MCMSSVLRQPYCVCKKFKVLSSQGTSISRYVLAALGKQIRNSTLSSTMMLKPVFRHRLFSLTKIVSVWVKPPRLKWIIKDPFEPWGIVCANQRAALNEN